MKKPSRKVREEAIAICAIAASNQDSLYFLAAQAIDASDDAHRLATRAWLAAVKAAGYDDPLSVVHDAEAECLLREGWCP